MLCGGLAVHSPLCRNNCGPGKEVGLSHYTVLFAKALSAEVYAFTHSADKAEGLEKMGVICINVGQT